MIEEEKFGEYHEPSDEAFACFRLELHRPLLEGDDKSTRAWQEIRAAHRTVGQALQRGFGDVVVHVRNLRSCGKARFATPSEKANVKLGVPLPSECYTDEDLKPFVGYITDALRGCGVSEYVYASIARRVAGSELSGEKFRALLRGEQAYPVVRNAGIMMRARNWRLTTEPRISGGKEYLDIVVETAALRPRLGHLRLVAKRIHGPSLSRSKKLLAALSAMEWSTVGETGQAKGWSKGALILRPVRRPGQPEKWEILLPYSAPRIEDGAGGDIAIAVHRSVANMLTAATSDGSVYHFPGRDIVLLKHQMYARRRFVQQDLAQCAHRGRGRRRHFAALRRLADAEARATQTHLWRAARWVQTIAERVGAKLVLLDDFTSFDPDLQDNWIMPYVRRFPFADLKLKTVDALTRRAGIPVQEISSRYISQTCPKCGYTHRDNIARLPKARGVDVEKGVFSCGKCRFSTDLDAAAALNLLKTYANRPPAKEVSTG